MSQIIRKKRSVMWSQPCESYKDIKWMNRQNQFKDKLKNITELKLFQKKRRWAWGTVWEKDGKIRDGGKKT